MTSDLAAPPRAVRLQGFGRRYPLLPVFAGVVLYSVGPVLVQASSVSGPVFSFWRLWIGVPVLGVAALAQRRAGSRPVTVSALRWPLYAGMAFAAHQLLFMTALKLTSVTDVSLMNTLAPLVIAIAAVPLFGERPGAGFRAWTVLAMAGAAVVVVGASAGPDGHPLGMALGAANVVFFAAFFLVSKLSRDHIDVLPLLFGTMLVAALAVSAFAVVTRQPVAAIDGRDLLLAAGVAAGPGAVGHFVSTWPLRWLPANVPPVARLLQPLLSGALAFVILAEPVTAAHIAGGLLTITGVCGALLAPSGRRFAARSGGEEVAPAPPHSG